MGWDCSILVMVRACIIFICGDTCGHQASSSNLILSTTTVLVFLHGLFRTSNLHIHFSFLYLALIGFEWKGQGYMTSIHETTTTRGTIMMNTGRIDIGGLGLRNESLVMVTCQG
jgi:hypothetical protein